VKGLFGEHNFQETLWGGTMGQGVFITFEGIDGCGKSFIQKMVYDWLITEGYRALSTLEPGGSEFGKAFRRMLLESSYGSLDPWTETLLFMVDRSRHVEEVIRPALADGAIVLCDRYIDSTIAYQGGGRGLDIAQLQTLNNFAIKGVRPDLTLFLSVTIDKAMSRQSGKKDRLEQESIGFFQNVAAMYETLATAEPDRITKLDGSGNPDEVFNLVKPEIIRLLTARGV
jgi:dTMP kinase